MQPREYRLQHRPGGMGAVIRVGVKGGERTVTVYRDRDVARQVVQTLNSLKNEEA